MTRHWSGVIALMQLRPFRPSDLQTLHDIDQACFPPGVSYSQYELGRFIFHRDSKTWVADVDDDIVGFLIANRHPTLMLGHVTTVDVVRAWRRRGVGSALMDAAEKWASECGYGALSLETSEHNTIAQKFYEKRGYVRYEKLDRYYADGAAAWIMVKWLNSMSGRRVKPKAKSGN